MRLNSSGVLVTTNDASISGLTVGKGAGAISSNTAVGSAALNINTTGTNNTAFGNQAGSANTSGTNNTSLGYLTLGNTTSVSNNTAVGSLALLNSNAANNTAVGFEAGRNNTTGVVTAVGSLAARANTTGAGNTAVGLEALNTNTTGGQNTAIGSGSLLVSTTSSNNTGIGSGSLFANTTGSENTALGRQSLFSNTTASNNTAVGYQAGYSATTSSENTAIGYQALYTNSTSGDNVAVGRNALRLSTAAGNTVIGEGGGSTITTGAKNTILGRYTGNQGGLDIRTANNYIVLSDGDGNPRSIINENGVTWVGSALGNSTLRGKMTTGGLAVLVGGGTQAFEVWDDNDTTTARFRVLRSGTLYAQGVYSVTTASAANVNVASDGGMARSTSSLKYKTNVQNSTHGLAEVMQLRPVTYKGINDGELVFGGLIAEEVDAVGLSEFVQYADDGSPDALAYGNMVSLCIKAIQELNQKIEAQALEIAQLKGN
jgi:hypothetical protein